MSRIGYVYQRKKKIFIFTRFDQNMDFDRCLKKENVININEIEIVEIANGQHSILIKTNEEKTVSKLCTFDLYQTQAFLNILLS
jgi:hypothetical protein